MKEALLIALSLITGALVFWQAPIAQDPLYHQFADQRSLVGIPNFLNVVSNLPYLVVGYLGFAGLSTRQNVVTIARLHWLYRLFFAGVMIIGVASAYYHLFPNNTGLMLDRLPIAVAFMAFFAIVIAEFIDHKLAVIAFPLLLFVGLASVLYWYWTETLGQGDLRLYLLVQFLPIILIAVILLLYQSRFSHSRVYWWVLICYIAAKGFEHFDAQVFAVFGQVSGHTMKHLVSSLAPILFYLALKHRQPLG